MASAFWTLEDGRGFSRRWAAMSDMLELITVELKEINGAENFSDYLKKFVFREEKGDEYNGFGGFIRNDENIMLNFDLRSFTSTNRNYFWEACNRTLIKLKLEDEAKNEAMIILFTSLLNMHKRIRSAENPMKLNHMKVVEPESNEKLGPGWS